MLGNLKGSLSASSLRRRSWRRRRVYGPEGDVKRGDYTPPAIEKR